MDIATDLLTLVNDLKSAAYDEQIYILQTLGGKLINDCHIDVFGMTIEPLWVEAYYYDEAHFPDCNTHRSSKQKNRFGQLYFHERGYGGADICLSDSEDFCLSFLLKATLTNGHFLTQTQLPRFLLDTGKTKADFQRLNDILVPADARHIICHTTRVNLARPCYRDAPLASFALDAIGPEFLPRGEGIEPAGVHIPESVFRREIRKIPLEPLPRVGEARRRGQPGARADDHGIGAVQRRPQPLSLRAAVCISLCPYP